MLGTLLQIWKLKNVKYEMAWLGGINDLWVTETRWPGEDDYKSDGFRIIHSRGEESQRGVALKLDERTAICVEKVPYEGDRLLMVKLCGKPVDMCYHPFQVYRVGQIKRRHLSFLGSTP